ncbi:MAG: TolC family protein [Chlorobiaceae bacterium]|nr:TolC family protein [Chlorobiaceae bacterium]NTV60977.1 TolC family protein [Chlorobiaceae bacterium]
MDKIFLAVRVSIISLSALFFFHVPESLRAEETLTWQQCVEETKQAHPDLYSALAAIQQAEADKNITGGARLPRVTSSVSVQRDGTTEKGGMASSSYSYGVTAQQLIFDGSKTSSLVSGTEETIKASRYSYHTVSSRVRYALRSSFIQLLKAQDLVGLTREIAERRRTNVRLIGLRYQGGREHSGSLAQAQADLAQAEYEVAEAGRSLVLAQSKLASALGREARASLRARGSYTTSFLAEGTPDFTFLAGNNPAFLELEAKRKAARFELDAARHAFSPELYLSGSVGRNTVDSDPFDAFDWNAGLSFTLPIYEGGIGRAKVSRAMAVVSQQNAEVKSGYLQLLDTLEESWKLYQDAVQAVTVRKKYLAAAIERSTIANAQYSNGLLSFNEWVIIENNLVSAKKEFLNAEAELLTAEAQWIQAKGGGLDG